MTSIRSKLLGALLLGAALLTLACGGDDGEESFDEALAAETDAVVRQILGARAPETAPDQLLELTRVIIPAGEQIAPHTHPGPQLAVIVAGTLTYTVLEGEVTVTRAAATDAAREEHVSAGASVELNPGDSLIETPGMVHQAHNQSDVPVLIYLASLFPEGAPPSSPAQ